MLVEEGDSERDLVYEGFDRISDCTRIPVEHVFEMGSDNREHQHLMFPVYSPHCEMVQEGENVFRSRVFANPFRLCRKMTVGADLVAPASKFCHHKF